MARSSRLRALGTGHSFTHLADGEGDQVSVRGLPAEVRVDPGARTASVSAGLRYGEVSAVLHARGWALHNLGSLPHISVAGACATGTHGSGTGNGGLATAVAALDLVDASGTVRTLRRGSDDLRAAAVGLGAFGVVTRLELDVEPTYEVEQVVHDDLPFAVAVDHLDEVLAAAYSVSLFTSWRGPVFEQVWLKRRTDGPPLPPPRWLGSARPDGPRHPVPGMAPVHCTDQTGAPGPWHERLPHFRLDHVPSSGHELQSEYLLPRAAGREALRALDGLRERVAPVLQVCEVRAVAADDLWLSPCHERDVVAVHFTWLPDAAAVLPVVAAVEERLLPLAARPHWGKVTATPLGELGSRYPRLDDVRALVRAYDPDGTFGNPLVDPLLRP